jgi:hypothetical protein
MPLGSGSPFDAVAQELRWVAWRNELRSGKMTKVPYAPNGKKAKADDPATWGTRAEAEARAAKLVNGQGELAVDREVEQSEISFPALQLKPNANGPDIFRPFCPIKRPLFQGARLQETGSGIAVCMVVASSIPTVPLPAPPMRRHANLPNHRCRWACGRSALDAPMARERR